MPKIFLFSDQDFQGVVRILQNNDPNLVLNEQDQLFESVIVVGGTFNLYNDVQFGGEMLRMGIQDGPDGDGVFRDYGDWNGDVGFHVRSIEINN